MNGFSEDTEVVDLGREFQRDDTLLEKKFKDELNSFRIIQISFHYIPAVNINEIVDQLIDHHKICMTSAVFERINI